MKTQDYQIIQYLSENQENKDQAVLLDAEVSFLEKDMDEEKQPGIELILGEEYGNYSNLWAHVSELNGAGYLIQDDNYMLNLKLDNHKLLLTLDKIDLESGLQEDLTIYQQEMRLEDEVKETSSVHYILDMIGIGLAQQIEKQKFPSLPLQTYNLEQPDYSN